MGPPHPPTPPWVTPELWALRTLFRWAVVEAMTKPEPMTHLSRLLPPLRTQLMDVLATVATRFVVALVRPYHWPFPSPVFLPRRLFELHPLLV